MLWYPGASNGVVYNRCRMVGSVHRKSMPTSRTGLRCMMYGVGSPLGVYSIGGPRKAVQYLACGPWTMALVQVTQQRLKAGASRQARL